MNIDNLFQQTQRLLTLKRPQNKVSARIGNQDSESDIQYLIYNTILPFPIDFLLTADVNFTPSLLIFLCYHQLKPLL